jgi:hypothetical protein
VPNRYIIHGAAFDGDGTSSAEATSNGGVGAWNNINIVAGTAPSFGTLAAGDQVYIRSKSSAGADITVSVGAAVNLGSAAATASLPVTWVLDGGAVWPGVSGTLTYSVTGAFGITWRPFNRFVSDVADRWVTEWPSATGQAGLPATIWSCVSTLLRRVRLSLPVLTEGSGLRQVTITNGTMDEVSALLNVLPRGGNGFFSSASGRAVWINPRITINTTDPARLANAVFGGDGSFSLTTVYGGSIEGLGAQSSLAGGLFHPLTSSNASYQFEAFGLQVPKAFRLSPSYATYSAGTLVKLAGLDGGSGAALSAIWGTADSRNIDNFYPVLNATLPDSASSGVSWRISPVDPNEQRPFEVVLARLYSDVAAVKTITLEFLVATPWLGGTPSRETVWMDLTYVDAVTGATVALSTRDWQAGALPSSTAAWSSTSWGAVGFDRHRLQVTTPTAIRRDTLVVVSFRGTLRQSSSNEVIMVCPDPQFT